MIHQELLNQLYPQAIAITSQANALLGDGTAMSQYLLWHKSTTLQHARFLHQEFVILIAGELSTGKSTLINRLLGFDLITVAHEACTNVPIVIRYGKKLRCTVVFIDDGVNHRRAPKEIAPEDISLYSTEQDNTKNRLGVHHIEIQVDSPLLAEGIVLIDTPGLGALEPMHSRTTFEISAIADMIFYLGRSDKELTRSEITDFNNLIECSKADHLVHILTWADEGHPDKIIAANKANITKEMPSLEIDYFVISSKLYQDYLDSGDTDDLEDSGFPELMSYLAKINHSARELIIKRHIALLLLVMVQLQTNIDNLIRDADDPVKSENRRNKLIELRNRINELIRNRAIWLTNFHRDCNHLSIDVDALVDDKCQQTIGLSETQLKDDFYLNNPNVMANFIQGKLVSINNEVQDKISQGYVTIYENLRTTSGLSLIENQIFATDEIDPDVKIPEDCGKQPLSLKMRDGFICCGMGMLGATLMTAAVGTSAGAAVLAKTGAALGTTIAPGVGTAIGAIVGAVTGIFATHAMAKQQKRQKMMAEITKQIYAFAAATKQAARKAKVTNDAVLENQFQTELNEAKDMCEQQLGVYSRLADTLRTKWDELQNLKHKIDGLVNTLKDDSK